MTKLSRTPMELDEAEIEMVRRRLQLLLGVVQVESDGEPVEVGGFRLRQSPRRSESTPSETQIVDSATTTSSRRLQ